MGFTDESGESDEERGDPGYTEEDLSYTESGLQSVIGKSATPEVPEVSAPVTRAPALPPLPNLITKDHLFRSSANPYFLARLLSEPSIEMVYITVQPWIHARRAFVSGPSDVIQQLTRYGVSYVSTSGIDEMAKSIHAARIYVEFLLDPFHKQKVEEERKRQEDLERRRAIANIATFGKHANSDSESSEDELRGVREIDINANISLQSMVLDIEEEEIPAFVDERVHFDVIMEKEGEMYYIVGLQFYIVNIQK